MLALTLLVPLALSCLGGDSNPQARPEFFANNPGLEKDYRKALREALLAGVEVLERQGSSVEAVEAAIRVMEDLPLFNAGKGASFTSAGTHELDACIMNGKTLRAGGIGAVTQVRNPISLARLVMEETPHVLLVGEGALAFAREQGVVLMADDYFFTQRRWDDLQRRLREDVPYGASLESENTPSPSEGDGDHFGTVGAVALDQNGNLAAGTSTGGRIKKRPGRVGDSPIIGASTYANNSTCAVSTTGLGEKHMVLLTAKEISALVEHLSMPLQEAAELVVKHKLVDIGGSGGAIALDRDGNVAMPFTANGMYRGYAFDDGEVVVDIY
jgi:beta-aspartyl-peptidase (threonine type)